MSNILFVIVFAVVVVGLFVLAMSLTLIFKGHHIDSEIGTNRHMQERGIRCTAEEFARQDGCDSAMLCGKRSCNDCTDHTTKDNN